MLLTYQPDLTADVIDIGQGRPVLLVHSAGTGAAQWRALVKMLAPDCRCLAPNQRGYGRSSPWPSGRPADVAAELALLETVADRAGSPLALVGRVSSSLWAVLSLAQLAGLVLSASSAAKIGIVNLFYASAAMLGVMSLLGLVAQPKGEAHDAR